jgi:hypothetical protein
MSNNFLQHLKLSRKIKSVLTEAALDWKQSQGEYPSVSEFVSHLVDPSLQLNESYSQQNDALVDSDFIAHLSGQIADKMLVERRTATMAPPVVTPPVTPSLPLPQVPIGPGPSPTPPGSPIPYVIPAAAAAEGGAAAAGGGAAAVGGAGAAGILGGALGLGALGLGAGYLAYKTLSPAIKALIDKMGQAAGGGTSTELTQDQKDLLKQLQGDTETIPAPAPPKPVEPAPAPPKPGPAEPKPFDDGEQYYNETYNNETIQ